MKRFLALISRPAVSFARRSPSLFGVTTAVNAFVLLPFLQACTMAPAGQKAVLPVLDGSGKGSQAQASKSGADLLTTASAAFAKAQPSKNSMALSTATPDFAPPGAGSSGNVDPATGKLTFGVPVAGIGGGTTPTFSLGLSYGSATVYETAINWNYEQVPGEVGLGWSLPAAHMRIARLPGSTGVAYDDSYMLMTGAAGYRLTLVGYDQTSNVKYYETNDGDFARLEFHDNSSADPSAPESNSYWVLTDATGIKYYYGWAYRTQDGASSADSNFATFCTELESGPIFQADADGCEYGPTELDVRWGSWTGVSYDTVNQEQFASSWYLSAIENINGLRTTLYYGRHTQAVGQQKPNDPERTAVPKTFGKATYLYKVVSEDGSQMTLNWGSRTATEILDPRQYNAEADGYQEKYQALYLSQVNTFDGGIAAPDGTWATSPTPVAQTALAYNDGVLLGFDNTEQLMGKRILTGIASSEYNFNKAAEGDATPFDPMPGYAFSYWGQNTVQQTENGATLSNDDGVSVSRWNDDQGYNAHKGALFGLIKSVTSPLGATTTYQYTDAQGTLVQRTLQVDDFAPYTEVNANRHAYVGPGYVLVSTDVKASGSSDVHNGFFVFAWTSTGWQRVVSQVSRGYYSGFTLQTDMDTYPNAFDFVSMGNGMVGVSLPNGLTNSAGHACNDVFVFQQQRSQESWAAIGDNSDANSPYFGSHCGNTRVAISNDTVGVVAGADQNWTLWHSNNNWQQDDGITQYSGTFSRTYAGQDIPVATQIGEGFAGFYFAPPPGNEMQDIVAQLAFIKDTGVQESSPGQANVVVTTAQIGQQFGIRSGPEQGKSWLDLIARAIYPQGDSPNLIVAMGAQRVYNSTQGAETGVQYFDPNITQNIVLRGTYVVPASGNNSSVPLPAAFTPIDYASSNGGAASDYVQWTAAPPSQQVSQTPAEYYCCNQHHPWVSDAISTGMMVGLANWATYTWQDVYSGLQGAEGSVQNQTCGATIPGPVGLEISTATTYPAWDNFGTTPSQTTGNACFFGDTGGDGEYSDPDLYSSDDVFALLRGNGGGYSSWVYDALNETIDRDQYATMTYFPPREHGFMQSKDWQVFNDVMEVVGIALLASGWGSAAGAALTGEMLNAATEGVMSAAFTAQMIVPMLAHERITGGPLSNFAASRRIFFFGENFWVRNADDMLSPVALPNNADSQTFRPSNIPSTYTLSTAVSGTISNYTPLTYSNGSDDPDNATYLFEFRNGDVRRTNDGTFAPADVPQIEDGAYWSSENPNVDSDNLTGDAAFILYDQGPKSQSFSARAGNDFTLFAVVDHASTGEIADKVVSSVTVDDGVKQTTTNFAYSPDIGKGTTGRYSLGGSTGLYAQTTISYQGTQETIFVASGGCLTSATGAGITLDSSCTGAVSSGVSTRFLLHADGRIESLASPGQCMLANASGTSLTLAACDPSNSAQLFALYDLPDATQPFALKSIGLSTSGDQCVSSGAGLAWTSCWQSDESQVLQISQANADNSGRTAGTTIVYNYAGSSSNRSVIDATDTSTAIPGYTGTVDFDTAATTRATTAWTTYFGELLGASYRTESYRDGQSTPYRSSDTMHEIVDLTRSGAYDGGLTRRLSRAAWITDTTDGVATVSAAEYNGLSQLRATHINTEKAVTAADDTGNVSLSAQTIRSSQYTYYAWEVPDYSAAMLAANRLADVYETFGAVSDANAAPDPVLASVTTYSQVNRQSDGAPVMLPLATYQARGNGVDIDLPQMVVGFSQLISVSGSNGDYLTPDTSGGNEGNWGCLVATQANGQASLSTDSACADVEGASASSTGAVYTAHKLVNPLDTQDASGNYHTLWLLESQTVPGQCLTSLANPSADGTTGFALAACDLTNGLQKFGLGTQYLPGYGFYTSFTVFQTANGTATDLVLNGFRDNSGAGTYFAPQWSTAGSSQPDMPEQGERIWAARAITYPSVELDTDAANCLHGVPSLTADDSCTTSTPRDSTWLLHANGLVESNGNPNLCFTAGSGGISVDQACGVAAPAGFRLVDKWYDSPSIAIGATSGYFALKSMTADWRDPSYDNCLAYPGQWAACTADTATELGFGLPLNVNLPLPAPGTLDGSPDAWIKKNEIVGRDPVTLQATDVTAYFGATENGTDLFLTSSVILSATNKGLRIASFAIGSALSQRAGYFGFEPYETGGASGTASYCTDANWSCLGGEVANIATSNVQPHAGSAYAYWSKSGGIAVSPVTFRPAIDINGQPLDTVVSAWVSPAASQSCSVGFTDADGNAVFQQSVIGDGSNWYYLEGIIPASSDIGTSVPTVSCADGGAIDDVRYSAVQAGFSATIYDANAYYRAVANLADNGNTARAIYDDRDDVMAGYVERLGTDHAVASRLTSGTMMAGFSRYGGFNLLNANASAPDGVAYGNYSSAIPNSVASLSLAPEASQFCSALPVQSSDQGCPATSAVTGTYQTSVTGSSFGLRMLVQRNGASDDPIEIGWQPPGLSNSPAVVFSFTDAAQGLGQFMFFADRDVGADPSASAPADATSDIVSLPRDWMIVAYEDNVAVFGDGKLLLAVSGKDDDAQWTVDNYLLTTDQTTITFDTDGASFTNVIAGSAPRLTTAYANAALEPMQSHGLSLMRMTDADSPVGSLVDVATGYLRDGWGRPAVQTLPVYYAADADTVTEMLTYRPGLLPVFDWSNGVIYIGENVASDLYAFYATGAGASRTLNAQDPQYAFSYVTRYQEPAGRTYQSSQPGWALSMQATQSRVTETDYQDWNDADLAQSIDIGDDTTLQDTYHTSTSSSGFGADLTVFQQSVSDTTSLTGLSRNSWETASTGAKKKTTLKLEDATAGSLFSALNVSLNGTSQVNDGPVATNSVSLLPNYFAGQQIASPGNFQQSSVSVDPLGQWSFTTDPDLTGATHVFRDDLGRLRFWRANPDMSDGTSQGFRYAKYDSIGRITETGVLLNVAEANLAAYAAWARDADLDTELNAGNSCAVHRFTYDVDPITGTNVAYSQSRGRVTGSTYFPTLVADMPTACPGRGDSDPVNRTYAQFDDLGRTTAQTDVRPGSAGSVMRSTAFAWNVGGMAPTLTYPDMDQTALFVTTGQSSLTSWPTVLGSAVRSCDGADCSGTVYTDLVAFDWLGMALTAQASNGIAQTISYDLRGSALSAVTQKDGATLMQETLRSMQSADNDNPCPGNAATPNFAGGLLIGRQLGGDGLPSQDQGIWSCYGYDGAGRLVETDNYLADGQSWTGQGSSVYAYDPNGNLTSAAIGVSSPAAKQGALRIKPSVLTPAGAAGTAAKPALGSLARTAPDVGAATAMSYVRSGNDQIAQATLASGNQVELAYDPTYGDVMSVASSVAGHAMAISRDPQTRKVVNETIASQSTNAAVLAVDMAYDGSGRRTGRTVSNPATSETSTTDYWYGSGIDPLVIVRDGVSYRVIQGILIEQRQGDAEPVAQYFVFNDHLGSVRMVTDADGAVVESIGYDGDWGLTRIAGQASPSSYDAMTAFWRFQGKEQETFPLSRLGIDDTALAAWLDDMQLYHFHYREYGAGLGAFLAIDPAGQDSSPYMAFGGNPANAVDPDGGWWEPALQIFVFSVAWGCFWAWSATFGDSLQGVMIAAVIVGAGRQVARYAEELSSLAMARVKAVTVEGSRIVVVARPEYYERASLNVGPWGRISVNVWQNFVGELVENAILAGTFMSQIYRDEPAGSLFGALVVIGLATPLLYMLEWRRNGGRGTVWKVVKGFPLDNRQEPKGYWQERAYAIKAFDLRFGLIDTVGQLLFRVSGAVGMFYAPISLKNAYGYLAGFTVRNGGGRFASGSATECIDGCQTPTDATVHFRAIYLDENGELHVQFYSKFGDAPPKLLTEITNQEVLRKIYDRLNASRILRQRPKSFLVSPHSDNEINPSLAIKSSPIRQEQGGDQQNLLENTEEKIDQ